MDSDIKASRDILMLPGICQDFLMQYQGFLMHSGVISSRRIINKQAAEINSISEIL